MFGCLQESARTSSHPQSAKILSLARALWQTALAKASQQQKLGRRAQVRAAAQQSLPAWQQSSQQGRRQCCCHHVIATAWQAQPSTAAGTRGAGVSACVLCGLTTTVCLPAAETVPDECQEDVYQFMITRGKNINANLPLGEEQAQQQLARPAEAAAAVAAIVCATGGSVMTQHVPTQTGHRSSWAGSAANDAAEFTQQLCDRTTAAGLHTLCVIMHSGSCAGDICSSCCLLTCCCLHFCVASWLAAKACQADAEKLCKNTWVFGPTAEGRIIACLR